MKMNGGRPASAEPRPRLRRPWLCAHEDATSATSPAIAPITRKGGLAPAARFATAPPPPSAGSLRSRSSAPLSSPRGRRRRRCGTTGAPIRSRLRTTGHQYRRPRALRYGVAIPSPACAVRSAFAGGLTSRSPANCDRRCAASAFWPRDPPGPMHAGHPASQGHLTMSARALSTSSGARS
jgi:hypothetical protein